MTAPGSAGSRPQPWSSGLFSCLSDCGTCCFGCLCAPCLYGRTYAQLHDTGCCGACCLYAACPCMACLFAADTRRAVRSKYGLEVPAPHVDCCAHAACSPCALCQEARELKARQYHQH